MRVLDDDCYVDKPSPTFFTRVEKRGPPPPSEAPVAYAAARREGLEATCCVLVAFLERSIVWHTTCLTLFNVISIDDVKHMRLGMRRSRDRPPLEVSASRAHFVLQALRASFFASGEKSRGGCRLWAEN